MSLRPKNIPQELKDLPQWVLWRYEERDGKKAKVPYTTDGQRAKVNDPTTWASFAAVSAAYDSGGFSGIGFVLTAEDPYTAIDLDDCVTDSAKKKLSQLAQKALSELQGYAEITPSGKGLRIIVKGKLPPGQRRTDGIEIYDESRYITVTGNAVPGAQVDIPERQDELITFYNSIFGKAAVLEREVRAGKFGEKFVLLFNGLWAQAGYKTESEGDMALCRLAAKNGLSIDEADQFIRKSGLFDKKWDRPLNDTTYGRWTLEKVYADVDGASSSSSKKSSSSDFEAIPLANVEPAEPSFLLYPWLPRRAVTFLDGDPGGGKSWLCMAIAAALTGDLPLPPLTPPSITLESGVIIPAPLTDLEDRKASVVLLTNEDELPVLRKRLDSLGGDPTRVAAIGHKHVPLDERSGITGEEIQDALAVLEPLKPDLLIIDPVTLYLSSFDDLDISNAVRVRAVMDKLLSVARSLNCAVLITRHFRKTTGKALYRGLGSVDFTALARSVLTLAQDKETGIVSVAHTKHNYSPPAPTVTFKVEYISSTTWVFCWEGTTDQTADELTDPDARRDRTNQQEALAFLVSLLSNGPLPATEIIRLGKEAGISERTLRRAAKKANIASRETRDPLTGKRKYVWELPQRP